MSKVIIGLFVLLLVIGIPLAIYFATKKGQDGVEEIPDKPQLTFDSNATKTINPQEDADEEDNGTQEGYRIEYAEGEEDPGNFIDLTLSWTNGQGFESVRELVFTRYIGSTKIQENMVVNATDFPDMLKDYGNGTVTFKGIDVSADVDVKGENIVKAYYNEVKPDNLLATAKLPISEEDFKYTLTGPFGDLDVKVTISSETFSLTKSVKKTYYQISHAPGQWFNVDQNSNGTIKFKFDDGKFLKFGDKDTFKLAKYKNKKMLTNIDGGETFVWVPNKQIWRPVGNLSKEDFRFAQCDLFGANTIMRSGDKAINPSDKLWLSPNKEFRAVYQLGDGNFVVYKENDSDNNVHAYASSSGSFNLRLSANGNLTFKKDGDELIKSAQGYKHAEKEGLTAPFTFMISDFGGLHVISREGTEVVNAKEAFGPLTNYHKTHAGDLWGYDNAKHTGESFIGCARKCDADLYCAGFTYDHGNKNCWAKNYEARLLGVDKKNDQNADRWSNTKEDGSTDWKKVQYYQKKVDANCYRDRYGDLKNAFGTNSTNLTDHYFNHGREEGRDPTCDFTVPAHAKMGYYHDAHGKYFSNEFDAVKQVGWEGCKKVVADKGYEIWGVRTGNHKSDWSNTCFAYTKGAAATELGPDTGSGLDGQFMGCVNGKTLDSGCTQ